MVEDLNFDGVVLIKRKKGISIHGLYFDFEEVEKIKDWLEVVLKPRYEVKTEYNCNKCRVLSSNIYDKTLEQIKVTFHPINGNFDCISRAEKYCEQLNKEDRG